jgi:hydrophobic/amphiphilic exporter-1 (mainly G- bacteria), HAE1 family
MWHLTKLALRSRILTVVVALILAGTSIWALIGLNQELIPNIDLPYETVVTIYPDATPDMVVKEVTSPIEKVVWDRWSGSGLKHLTSTSTSGMSLVMAEFEFGTDMTKVSHGISQDLGALTFPAGVTNFPKMTGSSSSNPQVIPINMNIMPVVSLSLSGDLTPSQLKQIADSKIVPQLSGIKGVLRVDTEGGQQDQVVIAPDPAAMNKYAVSMAQIAGLLAPEYSSVEAVGKTPLGANGPLLSDVARITEGPSPYSAINRTNGKTSVGISITKTEDSNTVNVGGEVASRVKALEGSLGPGVQLTTVFNQADYITDSINQLWEKAIIGGVLAIAVVFLFLWAVRASLITAISIPLSILLGFLGMRLAGLTINLLTLSAMSIAVGRLIDDSIVMVEVIFRRRQRGEGFREAAIGGAREVATPITTATLATVAIFIPLMFVGGIVGELFIPFALTVTFAMIASLLVALMVVPALSRFLMSNKKQAVKTGDNWYQKIYSRSLHWTLLHRVTAIVITLVLFVGSLGLLPVIGSSFMSMSGSSMITVSIQLPANTDISLTSSTAMAVESLLKDNPAVKNYGTVIGTGASLAGIMSAASGGGSNTATISVYLNSSADIKAETARLSRACAQIGGNATIEVSDSESGGSSFGATGVKVSIRGKNLEDVAGVTNRLVERLKGVKGLANLDNDLTTVVPRLNIAIDPEKVAAAGLTGPRLQMLQQEFYLLTVGATVPFKTVKVGDQSYPIYIKGVSKDLNSIEQARELPIGYPQSLALIDIASVTMPELPSHISHTDTFLSASITAAVTDKNVGAINQAIQKEIDSLPSHPGVEVKVTGIAEQMNETLSRMGIAIIIAIVIVFLIVILMMRSIVNPVLIMISLPLATIGAFIGLAISRFTLSVSAMMGLLMLVGIVLTNAIVLVTLVEQLRKNGLSTTEALMEGGKTRLRPILMTALTTIFAMVPMAVGLGSGTMLTAELAVVVIGGLFSSTLLTLFVIPVFYSLVHRGPKAQAIPKETNN